MKKTMKTDEVIDLIKQGISVEDIVLSDIEEKRLSFRDALLLVEHGFLVSEKNMLYRDSDIAHDPEFDEVEWEGNYTSLKDLLSLKGITKDENEEIITIELSVKDEAVKDWLNKNTDKLKDIVNKLVIDLYHTDQILHSKR
ncbi:MAG: hypothetical protein IPJ00_15950 [Saprospirales bacterium]|nr:hypothetical protein [Saprospirales bacterium]